MKLYKSVEKRKPTGYVSMEIYIERDKEISLREWREYIKTDLELVLMESGEAINPITKQKMKMAIEGRALFGDSEILYKKGCIGCDDYSEKALNKLREIAKSLGADIYEDGGAPSNEI